MILPLVIYGSHMLRQLSSEVHEDDLPEELSVNMLDTLKKHGGIGLAGPQVGLLKRIFVMDTAPLQEDDSRISKVEQVFINPRILEKSTDLVIYNEGCLSIPGIYRGVERPEKIRVSYQNLLFETIEEELDGVRARIFQHEYDHLEGVLFIDKLSPLQRKLITGKLRKIRKQR